jgi:hypothetical protein
MAMFTIDQINDLHARLGSAKTLAEDVRRDVCGPCAERDREVDRGHVRMTMTFFDKASTEMLVEQIS